MNNKIFKIYNTTSSVNHNDTIFNIIGDKEPELTKSLSFLLYYDDNFFYLFIYKFFGIKKKNIILKEVYAEKSSANNSLRRDITLKIITSNKEYLIIIEAKGLNRKNIGNIETQLANYVDNKHFPDVNNCKVLKSTITLNRIIIKDVKSITWVDIIKLINQYLNKCNLLTTQFKEFLMFNNSVKTIKNKWLRI